MSFGYCVKTVMAEEERARHSGFDLIFRGSFPHILEAVFFSLDYVSFKTCPHVCKEWNRLFSSKSFKKFEHSTLKEIRQKENDLLDCSIRGKSEMVSRLLSTGISPNCRKLANGKSPLHIAAQNGDIGVIKALLHAGADPNMSDRRGKTSLHWATVSSTEDNDQDIVKALLDAKADPNRAWAYIKGETLHNISSTKGNILMKVVKLLLNSGADPNKADIHGRTPLHSAKETYLLECSIQGNGVEISRLLSIGVSPNCRKKENGKTPLHYAVQFGYTNVIKLLLVARADPNISDRWGLTPLNWASESSEVELNEHIVKVLLDEGGDPNNADKRGTTPLHTAARVGGNRKIVQLLLGAGADPNRKDDDGKVPLHFAVQFGYTSVIKLLLDARADPNISDRWGRTPLNWASDSSKVEFNEDIVKVLLDAGGDPNNADKRRATPLHAAARVGNRKNVQLLLGAGADPNRKDDDGKVPLHYVAKPGQKNMITLLLNAGAYVNIADANGETPLNWVLSQI